MPRLTPELLLCAYASGLFPMANDRHDPTIHWIEPRRRGVLPLEQFHMSRSLKKVVRQQRFTVRIDHAFRLVVEACAEPRVSRPRTWLNDELIALYSELHRLGYAHSVEAWLDGRLVGGLYGVSIGAAFFGESMFSLERDASKVALVTLVERLALGNYHLLDTQFVTDHLRRFGAIEVSRDAYRRSLRHALGRSAVFYSDLGAVPSVPPWAPAESSTGASQSSTQRS
ncbi:MAG TPA: leucyl/phenylalanyl-tRNA--protein transferase [Geminicoccaceae bacterium]